MFLELVLLAALISLLLFYYSRKPADLPPGPYPVPLVGNLFSLDWKRPYLTLSQWAQTYGPVLSFRLGTRDVVVISDDEIARDVFMKSEVNDRPPTDGFQRGRDGLTGMVAGNGHVWHENRRFTQLYLRGLVSGGSASTAEPGIDSQLEDIVREEVEDLIKHALDPHRHGLELDLSYDLRASVANITWAVLTGRRLERNGPDLREIALDIIKVRDHAAGSTLTDIFPWIHTVSRGFSSENYGSLCFLRHNDKILNKYSTGILRQHKLESVGEEKVNFINRYLKQINLRSEGPRGIFSDFILIHNMDDLLSHSCDVMATTILWALYFLSRYLDVQEKVAREIRDVIGFSSHPQPHDQEKMPLTRAFLSETLRMSSVLPLGLPHYTIDDINLQNYTIPKGTQVWCSIYHIHHNGDFWKNPDIFDISHFLGADGRFMENMDHYLPFGEGHRRCLADSFAQTEFFLFVTSLVQSFQFRLPMGFCAQEEVFHKGSFTRNPPPFKIIPSPRK